MTHGKRTANTEAQAQRFIDAARQTGADESEDAFKAKLERIARQQPRGDSAEPPKRKKPAKA